MNARRIVVVDDAVPVGEFLALQLHAELALAVDVFHDVSSFIEAAPPEGGWSLAIIDLSFQQSQLTGLDALLHLFRTQPDTPRILYTQSDDSVIDLLRDVWEAIPLATVLSKSMPTVEFIRQIAQVLRDGSAPIDPVIRLLLPSARSPSRSIDSYSRLIQHAGHAKLWNALAVADVEPSYRDLAAATRLSVNTVRNYRGQLLGELRPHGLNNPTMHAMQVFARRCRPLLQPLIDERLA